MPRRPTLRAFSLIEMIVVVLVVGILAMLAVVAYRKWVLSSRVGEAYDILNAIRTAEESFKAENGAYVNVSAALEPPNTYPQANPVGTVQTQWGGPCGTCTGSWSSLNMTPSAPVAFGYAVVAGAASATPPTISYNGTTADLTALVTQPWYVAEAYCDLDGKGTPDTQIYALSSSNQLLVDNEGQ